MVPIVVCGAAGRMGRRLIALGADTPGLRIAGAVEAPGHPAVGTDAGELAGGRALGVRVTDDLGASLDPSYVVIDFTVPASTVAHARLAAERGAGLVIGTTGLTADESRALHASAARTRSVIAANFSVGVTVLTELVATAARLLESSFEAEIVELHHHDKRDAPSGTALALARAVAAARGLDFERAKVTARSGEVGARRPGEIGIVALRGGDVVGDHTVLLVGMGERLELTHRAQSRDSLVRGALRAARWVAGQPAGVYGMRDVLGL
ncbi:MAG TPA: 4-hydroxy-tetrahydrodipicolinate reductase [Candidatus Limnocylindria bacterium]|nr:4-hydroxy-tetrahydrodipicolinate reductase [Candidatus Limnocylindria bacterium]